MKTISAQTLKEKMSDDIGDEILLDVREPYEHKNMRIPLAENIPYGEISDAIERLKSIGTVYVHCTTGGRSARVCQVLEQHGVNVVNVEGGIESWREAGFEVLGKGKHVIPIMRQVMIVAGTLVSVGMLFGMFMSSWWYILPAFVGAGLLFAGITGICFTTRLLLLMPWNRA
jgi:rhodanese-related sulfurtransferase